jgi:FkbM family methyltransferase
MSNEFCSLLNLEYRFSKKHNKEFLWPADDVWAWKWLNKKEHWNLPIRIAKLCKNTNLVIQAGGNAGLYPKLYSGLFSTVMTFEPDFRNFFCLSHNAIEPNIFKYQAALGNTTDPIGMAVNPLWNQENAGALRIQGQGKIPQLTIDSLGAVPNLIHLDIEGFEAFALLGAEKTIKKHNPLIVLETNDSGDAYGWRQEKIDALLYAWGYKILENWEHDTVYIHENH